MKLSVSLPGDDVAYIDSFAQARGYGSRSAVIHTAVDALRAAELASAYEEAWASWRQDGQAAAWESTVGDGLTS